MYCFMMVLLLNGRVDPFCRLYNSGHIEHWEYPEPPQVQIRFSPPTVPTPVLKYNTCARISSSQCRVCNSKDTLERVVYPYLLL